MTPITISTQHEAISAYAGPMARMSRSTTRIGTVLVAAVAVMTLTGCPSNGGSGTDGDDGGIYGFGADTSVVVELAAGAGG
jgi:hypothetical protein